MLDWTTHVTDFNYLLSENSRYFLQRFSSQPGGGRSHLASLQHKLPSENVKFFFLCSGFTSKIN